MKFFAIILFIAQVVLIQNAYSQVIRAATSCAAPMAVSAPIVAQPSVAASLADTLSLLTVSSLLAETLPYNAPVIAAVPVPMAAPSCASSYAPVVSCGGCGYNYGCGCGNYGIYY